ncbi:MULTISPECIES: hypothetical protein [Mycetocola]|uniref:Uncharacterized protein n=1 Tax=Mycetocola lacteus TaxID=76637 RepID=A0A3L7AU23_9MICO|nr:hypothetical protein [Mycetocola lacteus]RLP83654.1 hypothetical protein D9V34_02215 [Mycetocola lacteus]
MLISADPERFVQIQGDLDAAADALDRAGRAVPGGISAGQITAEAVLIAAAAADAANYLILILYGLSAASGEVLVAMERAEDRHRVEIGRLAREMNRL